ncbi:MAG TPA: glutaredoxin domain-containing protein [Gammaproteobacteria bacterium]|nr:glutaredoxin domain-containing protein [Gammaproteobacteria bacterium]
MKKIFLYALIAVIGYKGWVSHQAKEIKPLYDHPYVVVYGRDSCGFTQQTIKDLRQAGIKFEYMKVDDKAVADVLHSRMESMGLDTGYYLLPVVDVNNSLSIRPENKELIARAKSLMQ